MCQAGGSQQLLPPSQGSVGPWSQKSRPIPLLSSHVACDHSLDKRLLSPPGHTLYPEGTDRRPGLWAHHPHVMRALGPDVS